MPTWAALFLPLPGATSPTEQGINIPYSTYATWLVLLSTFHGLFLVVASPGPATQPVAQVPLSLPHTNCQRWQRVYSQVSPTRRGKPKNPQKFIYYIYYYIIFKFYKSNISKLIECFQHDLLKFMFAQDLYKTAQDDTLHIQTNLWPLQRHLTLKTTLPYLPSNWDKASETATNSTGDNRQSSIDYLLLI